MMAMHSVGITVHSTFSLETVTSGVCLRFENNTCWWLLELQYNLLQV